MKSYEELRKFLDEALDGDPRCLCGCRKHRHSDEGPCYGCSECDYFIDGREK